MSDKLLNLSIILLLAGIYTFLPSLFYSIPFLSHNSSFLYAQIIILGIFILLVKSKPSIQIPSLWKLSYITIILIFLILCTQTLVQIFSKIFLSTPEFNLPFYFEGLAINSSMFLITTLILAPILEEIIYRHYLFFFFCKKFSPETAVVLSSFCFSIFHFNLSAFIPLFVLALFLSTIYKREKNILYCIIPHILYNLFVIIYNMS